MSKQTKSGSKTAKVARGLTLEGEKQAIETLLTAGEDDHWQIGVHYNNVVDHGLAQKAGYKTAVEFFAKELKEIPQATLSRYGAVAKGFSEAIAKKYGCSKLAQLLAYENAAHLPAESGDPGAVKVGVPQKDGSVAQKAFKDCSFAELTEALKASKGAPALPAKAAAQVKALQKALDQALGKAHVEVRAHPRGHKVVIQLGAFDLDLAATVGDVLKSA